MNNQDYDQLIAQERKVLDSIKEQGEKLIPELKRRMTSYIRELSINILKSYFKHKQELTKSLGTEKLEEIKEAFTGILDALPEQTSQRLDTSQIWLHRVEIPEGALSDMTYSYQLEKRSNKAMEDAIRELVGLVGSILINYGFVEDGKDLTWETTAGGLPRYANDLPSRGMEHHRALTNLMEEYKNILIEYVYSSQNLWKAEKARKSTSGS